ncbi:hypothetical protein HPB51_001783 [Rhipicephalus microplus]|uniref:Ubiquitin-conjugating enzyme E2 Z n=1 Tax=Rhipicephalus microplus TaxID=6941 RepID=A0A9J6EWE4_RHIMP|nr:hypothetical protein HPB51_001783 [Rhipicephalus microplus]
MRLAMTAGGSDERPFGGGVTIIRPGIWKRVPPDKLASPHILSVAEAAHRPGLCPPDYPASPPRVRNMTTDAGRVSFHPYIYASGTVCLCVQGTCPGQTSWKPTHSSIETVLASIQSLLNEKTCFEESGPDNARRCDAFIQHARDDQSRRV